MPRMQENKRKEPYYWEIKLVEKCLKIVIHFERSFASEFVALFMSGIGGKEETLELNCVGNKSGRMRTRGQGG